MSRRTATASDTAISRRIFLGVGGAAAAGVALPLAASEETKPSEIEVAIRSHRTLGRTGFKVSDVSIGGAASDANVIRYAYDKGVNYFDTAESYGNGDNERRIGEAMQFMDRSKLFITTKLVVEDEDTEEKLVERFGQCLERMKTEYADALFIHSVTDVKLLEHEGFHAAVKRLKADGRLKHAGVSSHGPRDNGGDSMEKVLVQAAEDGRFDLMLFTYNYMNKEEGEKVLAACAENKVGTTAMKTSPGALEVAPFDAENPTDDYARYLKSMVEGGMEREDAVKRVQAWVDEQMETMEETRPFAEKHGFTTQRQLRAYSLQWVLQNPDMHTVCMGIRDFDMVDAFVALSGKPLTPEVASLLGNHREAFSRRYCRHGCTACIGDCPHDLPVSTIMRYSYYFACQGREKHAMAAYANLGRRNANVCLTCQAPCAGACPHGVSIQANLVHAHSMLTLA